MNTVLSIRETFLREFKLLYLVTGFLQVAANYDMEVINEICPLLVRYTHSCGV